MGEPKTIVTFRDLVTGLRSLNLDRSRPVIVHASLSSFGEVRGGVDTLLGALSGSVERLIMPTFTYKTMIIPEVGPDNNGLTYGSGLDTNKMSEFFKQDMPADPLMGATAEALRHRPDAHRSLHPILSFTGVKVAEALQAQTIKNPLAPVGILAEQEGWVLLMGVDHTVNTAIHYAEKLAGRRQFTRWALTSQGVRLCPGFPGCSDGFESIGPYLLSVTRQVQIGQARVQAVPIKDIIAAVSAMLEEDPQALLCDRLECERCDAVRKSATA